LRKINRILVTKLTNKRKKVQEKLEKKSCNIEEHHKLEYNIEKLKELQEY
jgi:hypothetical protein